MEYSPILAPVVALIAWSLLVMLWMFVTRLPAMQRKGLSLEGVVGSRGANLDGVIDDEAQWKAHNYNHLMEQPTIFYAIALSLALMDFGGGHQPVAGLGLCRFPGAPQLCPGHGQRRPLSLPVVPLARRSA